MTQKQFNQKYGKYLHEGFDGLMFDNPTITTYLDGVFNNFVKQYPNFSYKQIKIKFGHARFYAELPHEEKFKVESDIDNLLNF